jgi:hypothetical protein
MVTQELGFGRGMAQPHGLSGLAIEVISAVGFEKGFGSENAIFIIIGGKGTRPRLPDTNGAITLIQFGG